MTAVPVVERVDATLPRSFAGGTLRRLRADDLASFQAYRAVPELGRYQGWTPMPDEAAAAFLAEMRDAPLFPRGDWIQLGIAAPDDTLVGDIGICVDADGRSAEIGFTLAPAAQGRGIATRAVREAIALAFATTGVERVVGITDRRNAASIRLLERCGFRRAESREAVFKGEDCVEDVFVLARSGAAG